MQDNFNFKAWLQEHRSGPYSKDNADYGKRNINESVEEAMDLTPPSPQKIYQSESEDSADMSSVEMAQGLVNMTLLTRVVRELAEEDYNFDKPDIVEAIRRATEEILEDLLDDLDWDRPLDPTFREDLKEYEKSCVQRGNQYYMVNDEGDTISGPYVDADCTRKRR